MTLRRYSESHSRGARSQQAWVLLTNRYAPDHRTVWYSHLGQIMQSSMSKHGLTGPVLADPLGNVLYYCQHHGLPLLTAIVVEEKTGLPAGGFPLSPDMVQAEQQKVFAFRWDDIVVPTADELEAARSAMTGVTDKLTDKLIDEIID
jgi:hypothetical protein